MVMGAEVVVVGAETAGAWLSPGSPWMSGGGRGGGGGGFSARLLRSRFEGGRGVGGEGVRSGGGSGRGVRWSPAPTTTPRGSGGVARVRELVLLVLLVLGGPGVCGGGADKVARGGGTR